MSVRTIRARVVCDRETMHHLWRTHLAFNERLPTMLSILLRMCRGESGDSKCERDLYQLIGRFILAHRAKNAPYLLNSVSIKEWNPSSALKYSVTLRADNGDEIQVSGSTWAMEAARLTAEGKLLYDKQAVLGDLPGTLQQMIAREAAAILSGHDALVEL